MITILYRNFMPILCLIERVHTDFKEGDAVPTKVKLLHMEKTIVALCLNAGTYLPRVQAKLDAFAVATQNGPLTDMQSKSKELLLGLKVLLKEYWLAAIWIGVLVRDCNWARRDPGSGKNALAVLESCLLVMLSLVGDQWANVEYIKTLVAGLVTWQRWHSRTPGCIHSEEYGEAMLSRVRAQYRIWTTITSLSGTSEIFVTLSHTLTGRKNLRFSLTDKCVTRYGSNMRKFIVSVSVASLPIVQCKPPLLWVVEAIVLRSVDDLRFPRTFAALPPRSVVFSVFHNYIRTLFRKNPPSDDLLESGECHGVQHGQPQSGFHYDAINDGDCHVDSNCKKGTLPFMNGTPQKAKSHNRAKFRHPLILSNLYHLFSCRCTLRSVKAHYPVCCVLRLFNAYWRF